MMAANCGMPAAEMTELLRKIRPKSSSSGKISSCIGRKDAGGIDQVNERQRAFEGDALRADELLGRLGKERAGLHGGVVGDDHAGNAGDIADARDDAGGGDVAPLLIHFVGGPETDLEKVALAIEQMRDPFARRQTTHFALPVLADLAAAFAQHFLFLQDGFASLAKGVADGGVGA